MRKIFKQTALNVCVCVRVCVSMQNFKSEQLLLIDIPCTVLCSDSPIVTTSTCTLILLPLVIDDFLVAHFNILATNLLGVQICAAELALVLSLPRVLTSYRQFNKARQRKCVLAVENTHHKNLQLEAAASEEACKTHHH